VIQIAEYVNKVKLKERIRYYFDYSLQLCEDIAESIDEVPTIDIVHCSECKHNEVKYEENVCQRVPMGYDIACYDQWVIPEDNFFCALGERK